MKWTNIQIEQKIEANQDKLKKMLNISDCSYVTWFDGMRVVHADESEIMISVKHSNALDYLHFKYKDGFEAAIEHILEKSYTIKFVSDAYID